MIEVCLAKSSESERCEGWKHVEERKEFASARGGKTMIFTSGKARTEGAKNKRQRQAPKKSERYQGTSVTTILYDWCNSKSMTDVFGVLVKYDTYRDKCKWNRRIRSWMHMLKGKRR